MEEWKEISNHLNYEVSNFGNHRKKFNTEKEAIEYLDELKIKYPRII